jgi:hypothetical protein
MRSKLIASIFIWGLLIWLISWAWVALPVLPEKANQDFVPGMAFATVFSLSVCGAFWIGLGITKWLWKNEEQSGK